MGRKRKDAVKKSVRLSVDEDLLEELERDGVNKSFLFSLAARQYLDDKNKINTSIMKK